ncbi:hypothetical protein BC937DRAFT_90442 [Endogone sp. FLAS-F59071]|nr:hypothetical protein BC937DRAFT_90442 [Endogone sp. FLAS-F59071]|eukprot:RUS17085.1 hypothetical protein BC937DRAFT_90442 [Endogone sp. FLAS-F59071]
MATIQQRRPPPSHHHSLRVDHSDSEGGTSAGDRDWIVHKKNQTGPHTSEDDDDWHLINDAVGKKNVTRFILNPGEKAIGSFTEILPSPGLSVLQDYLDANDSEIDTDTWGKVNAFSTTDDEVVPLSSDVEVYSHSSPLDLDEELVFTSLPSHDGAGNFTSDDMGILSDSSTGSTSTSPSSVAYMRRAHVVHPTARRFTPPARTRLTLLEEQHPQDMSIFSDDAGPVFSSLPDILLSDGGVTPPSFVRRPTTPPREHRELSLSLAATPHQHGRLRITTTQRLLRRTYDSMVVEFRPTITRERLREALESAYNSSTSGDEESVKRPTERSKAAVASDAEATDLDSIPSHHPSFGPTTTSALLHSLWATLRRLTERIMENEGASDSFSHLANEAALEGFLPFGSHLQLGMDTSATRPRHSAAQAPPLRYGREVESLVSSRATIGRVGSDCAIESLSERQRRGGKRAAAAAAAATAVVGEGGR